VTSTVRSPVTRYARSGDVHIAYQVVGDGPRDVVFVPPWVSHLAAIWEEPGFARMCRRLASFSRLIMLDRRGVGLSDRVPVDSVGRPEDGVDDIRAVMDAAGSERAAVFGGDVGSGQACMLFAARFPHRTAALLLYGTFARAAWAPDYPWGARPAALERTAVRIEATWGGSFLLPHVAPSRLADRRFRDWWARYQRLAASPGTAAATVRALSEVDVRPALPAIRAPTLVLHRTDDRVWSVRGARVIAEAIPCARLVELPGEDHLPFVGDCDAIVDRIEEFLTGTRPGADSGGRRVARSAWPAGLSDREVEVLRAVAHGRRSKQIAIDLGISIRTVNHHIHHIYEKVGIRSRAGITLFAFEHDLVAEPPPATSE
jgi:pimeloyl-ACP methyl ester carboxylesterase/DNA-binding CsgD family transcriptional regulator